MRTLMIGILGVVVALSAIAAQEPTCKSCPGTYIPNSEVQAYAKRAIQYANGNPIATHAAVATSAYSIDRQKIGRKSGFSASR